MSGIRKKLTILFITAAMCVSAIPVCAAENGSETNADAAAVETVAPNTQSFTIDKAVEYAKEHSRSMAALTAAEATAKAQKEENRKSYKDTREAIFKADNGNNDSAFLVTTGYVYRSYIFQYAVAQRSTKLKEYTLESEVKNAFYSYLNTEEKVDIAKGTLDSANERVTYAQVKYNNGTISENDLESFKLAAVKAQNDYNSAMRARDLGMIQLKSTLNYPQEDVLIVTGSFERQPMDATTPEEALKKSENSISRVNAEETLALAKIKRDKSVAHYTSGSAGAKSAKAEYAQAELDYYNTVEQQRISIYSAYNDMVSAYENLEYCDKSLEITEKNVEAAKRRYDLGLITSDDYLSAVQELDSLKNQISSAELSAYLAKVQYKLQYDCQNTISQEEDPLL
ncbi:MAG: TolC family protein [Candidatus Ornithomonoglobus sp.]